MPIALARWTLLALLAAPGCTSAPPPVPADESRATAPASGATPLTASVQVRTAGDSAHFVLQVTNTGASPVELEYSSGQRFDFVVTRDGRELWRWSADRMFSQALQSETLAPGATRTFEAGWTPSPDHRGAELVVTGSLVTTGPRVEQSARFRI